MSALALDRAFLLPRPGRLALRVGFGMVLPIVVLAFSVVKAPNLAFVWFVLLFVVLQIAAALMTTHKEILAASHSFFHRGLRRQLLLAQLIWAFGEAAVVALFVAFACPGAGVAVAASVFGSVLIVHASMALATLWLTWSYQLPFWAYILFRASPWLMRQEQSGRLAGVLGAPVYWLGGAAILIWVLVHLMVRPRLHRRLCGTMVLGSEDMLRPGRIQAYRRSGDVHRRSDQNWRWRQRLIGALLGRADVARRSERVIVARAWQVVALDAAVSITSRKRVLAAALIGTIALVMICGYYDARGEEDMSNWFAGWPYLLAVTPLYGLGLALLWAQQGAIARHTAFRAELVALGWLTLASLAAALILAGAQVALAAVLPPLRWGGREMAFTATHLHGVWLAPMLAPFAWLGVALRPRAQCTSTNPVLYLAFCAGNWLMSMVPYRESAPLFAGISLITFTVAFVLRRRWWARADLVH